MVNGFVQCKIIILLFSVSLNNTGVVSFKLKASEEE